MRDDFRETFAQLHRSTLALQEANQHLIAASQAQQRVSEGMQAAFTAALSAKSEHEDLRDIVQRLETLILQLTRDVRELRERLDGGRS